MHLTDYFMDLFAYVVYLVKTAGRKQPPFDQVKADILRLLGNSEQAVRQNICNPEEFDMARFMVCAWIDEMVLSSAWEHKGQWQREQLQRLFYNTFDAGEEVFDRLNTIGYEQTRVREIYYLCMALGFKGKFIRPEDDYLLEQLRTSNLKLIFGSSMGLPSLDRGELFPESYPVEAYDGQSPKSRFQFNVFTVTCLAAPAVLFCILFLIYRFSLGGIADNILKMVIS